MMVSPGSGKTAVVLYGAGGMAREAAWMCETCRFEDRPIEAMAFIVDDDTRHGETVNGLPLLSLTAARDRFPRALMVAAVGSPRLREALTARARGAGFDFASLIAPGTVTSRWVSVGEGALICPGAIVTTNVTLGDHVQINVDCTVSHDVVMADYATLAPGVHLSGRVELRRRAYVGAGAVVINGTDAEPMVIGEDAVVGAGAVVTRSVPAGVTVVGVPARPLSRSEEVPP